MTRRTASGYAALNRSEPLTFAHRGGAGLWPENTLEAFRGAVSLGCSHLETDLRMTRDGHIVVCHDARIDRTTDGSGDVSAFTLAELQRFDAGYRFSPDGRSFPARGQGVRIPSFAELVEAAPQAAFNVEIKERGSPDLPQALWEFIQRHAIADRIIVAAERHPLLQSFRQLSRGSIATSASKRECLKFWLASRLGVTKWLDISYQALQIPERVETPSAGRRPGSLRYLTPRLLESAHRLGIRVHVWTIDERADMRRLLDFGVDGLMSDYPDRLLEVVRSRNPISR
jgi:glycerophosphoryl diester phosphodiesterase